MHAVSAWARLHSVHFSTTPNSTTDTEQSGVRKQNSLSLIPQKLPLLVVRNHAITQAQNHANACPSCVCTHKEEAGHTCAAGSLASIAGTGEMDGRHHRPCTDVTAAAGARNSNTTQAAHAPTGALLAHVLAARRAALSMLCMRAPVARPGSRRRQAAGARGAPWRTRGWPPRRGSRTAPLWPPSCTAARMVWRRPARAR
jgi:hypothetical protein